MQHGMQLTDSSQLWMSNDLNLFAFLVEQCLSDILYINLNFNDSVPLCAVAHLANRVCSPKQREGKRGFGEWDATSC